MKRVWLLFCPVGMQGLSHLFLSSSHRITRFLLGPKNKNRIFIKKISRKHSNKKHISINVLPLLLLSLFHSIGRSFLRSPHSDIVRKACAACFSNSHTHKCGLRRKARPINSFIFSVELMKRSLPDCWNYVRHRFFKWQIRMQFFVPLGLLLVWSKWFLYIILYIFADLKKAMNFLWLFYYVFFFFENINLFWKKLYLTNSFWCA